MTRGVSVRTVTIAVEGGTVEVDVAGEGVRVAPLLCLHGWTLDRRVWAPQVEAIGRRRPVIAIDRRGFGRSTAPASLDLEPDDIEAVLDALSIKACIVIGMSQAGRVALDFAARFPQRVLALILQGAQVEGLVTDINPQGAIPLDAYRALISEGKIEDMRAQWRKHPLMHTPSAEARAVVETILKDYDGRDLLAPPPKGDRRWSDMIARIAAPMLVVTGDQETERRRCVADAIARKAPDARRVVIGEAGHLCNLCNADAFNAAVEAFLSDAGL